MMEDLQVGGLTPLVGGGGNRRISTALVPFSSFRQNNLVLWSLDRTSLDPLDRLWTRWWSRDRKRDPKESEPGLWFSSWSDRGARGVLTGVLIHSEHVGSVSDLLHRPVTAPPPVAAIDRPL